MTHPPNGRAAPGGSVLSEAPGNAPASPPAAPTVPAQRGAPGAPVPRRSAWAEGVDRLRYALGTEPGRLRLIGLVLALLVVAFGAVTAWQTAERSAAAHDVLHRSQPLTNDAASIFQALADADTAASTGFLSGGQEPAKTRERYDRDIELASEKLAAAASNSGVSSSSAEAIAKLNRKLPVYTGEIDTARVYNRQGLPLGGAWLRHASELMQTDMLQQAERLYQAENERLGEDYDRATPYPWLAIGLGVLTLAALARAQVRDYRRTSRVLNQGLVAAGAATLVLLLWVTAGHTVARGELNNSKESGVASLRVLNDARIASLKARASENLTLVNRGAVTRKVGDKTVDAYEYTYQQQMKALAGPEQSGHGKDGGYLGRALELADSGAGTGAVEEARARAQEWRNRHGEARRLDDDGEYKKALEKVIGTAGNARPTAQSFDAVDKALGGGITAEQADFRGSAQDGEGAMTGMPVGSGVLALLGGAGAVLGIGRRLSEYR
ncbi:hypothetical protein AB0J21_07635 [Streptomyces sp. NPDC049954]|uniref:hypothetical protein n=1 Tax=Streptomyces sp. NPDC049954 TaxID=3155779 RepID=UPI0034401FF9